MPASDKHKLYEKHLPLWQTVRDCVEGSQAIKSRPGINAEASQGIDILTLPGTRYLPAPNPEDSSSENVARYVSYRTRANFVNFTGFTKEALLGMIFRRDTELDLPTALEFLEDNANGGGLPLDQLIRDGIGDTLETGGYGLLADYPSARAGLTQAQVLALNLRPTILTYPVESILNWRVEMVGGVRKYTMVVLAEPREIPSEDGFSVDEVVYQRVLRLVDGVYQQELYDEDDNPVVISDGEDPFALVPRKADGSTWDTIPFVKVGSQNNDETPDKSVLYDIAEVNLAHYRNSADFEESAFMVGQPTLAIAGLNDGWVKAHMKNGVMLGSRGGILLPDGGSATLLQADANQMPAAGMESKELQMVKIGARIIQDKRGNETVDGERIRFAGQNSKLGCVIGNWESALYQVIGWVSEFAGTVDEFVLRINREFFDARLDPQVISAQTLLLDSGMIAKSDLRSWLRKVGIIGEDRTDEEIDAELGQESPLGGE